MGSDDENRLYFIIRSVILSSIAGGMFLATIWYLRTINFVQSIVIGTFAFTASLVISRLFDSQIEKLVRRILRFLNRHEKLKKVVLKYF